jgi:hypothetical protein
MYVSLEERRLTFLKGAVLFRLIQGMRNPFARGTILQSHGIGGSLAAV